MERTIYRIYKTKEKMWSWFDCAMCDGRFMEVFYHEDEMYDIDTCGNCNPEYQAMIKEKYKC